METNNHIVDSSHTYNNITTDKNIPEYRSDYILNEDEHESKEYLDYMNDMMDSIVIQLKNLKL